jgi:hypothetical protein
MLPDDDDCHGDDRPKEVETVETLRWNFDEAATLRVYKPGGLLHLDVDIVIRAPYPWFSGHDRKYLSRVAS